MRFFLDTSVLLAAAGSETGASRVLFDFAHSNNWTLLSSPYCVAEAEANLHKVSRSAGSVWTRLIRSSLQVVSVLSCWTAHWSSPRPRTGPS